MTKQILPRLGAKRSRSAAEALAARAIRRGAEVADRTQGALTEPLGIAFADLCQRDDALRQHCMTCTRNGNQRFPEDGCSRNLTDKRPTRLS
jgi:hypothetical protein